MSTDTSADDLRDCAEDLLKKLAGLGSEKELARAKETVELRRNAREYELMGRLSEAVSRGA
jgi:hypothetical protein